jgi:hypothetical protein
MRPIFNPNARVSVDCPSRVGGGALLGRIRSGFALVFATVLLLVELSCLLRELLLPDAALRVIAFDGETLGSSPEFFSETLLTLPESPVETIVSSLGWSAPLCGFAGLALAVRTAPFPFRTVEYKKITSCGGLLSKDAA